MATVTTSLNLKTIVAPIYSEAFDGIYNVRKDERLQIFKEIKGEEHDQQIEPMIYGFGSAPLLPDGTAITYDTGGETFVANYKYDVYGLAFAITEVLVEDGKHISVGKMFSEHLALSCIETEEINAANVLNYAFTTPPGNNFKGGDGVSLINTAHPGAMGYTYSNQLVTAAALSQSSLEQILIQVRNAVDDRGKKIMLNPKKLVTAPANMMQAAVLLKSVLRTGGANNDINPITAMSLLDNEPAVLSRLTSNTAWWVHTDAPKGLQIPYRRKLTKGMEGDFETGSLRYKATFRNKAGYTNPRTLFGTAGA